MAPRNIASATDCPFRSRGARPLAAQNDTAVTTPISPTTGSDRSSPSRRTRRAWYDGDETIPDVIVLESSVDVDVRVATDGRIVHVYRTHDDG
jgi:hypothetical protein